MKEERMNISIKRKCCIRTKIKWREKRNNEKQKKSLPRTGEREIERAEEIQSLATK